MNSGCLQALLSISLASSCWGPTFKTPLISGRGDTANPEFITIIYSIRLLSYSMMDLGIQGEETAEKEDQADPHHT